MGTAPLQTAFKNLSLCRFKGLRNPPWDENRYQWSLEHWHILAARLSMVIVFQTVLFLVLMMVTSLPEQSKKLEKQLKIQERIIMETVIQHDRHASKEDYAFVLHW